MCGIVGITSFMSVSQSIYNALIMLQHRGQDSAGITTIDYNNRFIEHKDNGLVSNVFKKHHLKYLKGNIGIGHVRYPTVDAFKLSEVQPFYVSYPYGIALAHNGNITNTHHLRNYLVNSSHRYIHSASDSEILLNLLAEELQYFQDYPLKVDNIFTAISEIQKKVTGAYACVGMIVIHGLIAFRDPHGIRPLVLGKRVLSDLRTEYMIASESVALDTLGFELLRDIAPGEIVYITMQGQLFSNLNTSSRYNPCLFEYIYFARPDSLINKISVHDARMRMGVKLGKKIIREWKNVDIDAVIPIPETSIDAALETARILNVPYRQGFVKNNYIGRTFIMSNQQDRFNAVRRKINVNKSEFYNKKVLLIDDSIVRGTTSRFLVKMARESGAVKVYFASISPEIRFPNFYGIDIPDTSELIAYNRNVDEICQLINADALIFQDLEDLVEAVREGNPDIIDFECSVFNGVYLY